MVKRLAMLALAALCCGGSSGCMLMDAIVDTHDRWAVCYRQRHWMGCECGEFYWSEWFNDPPACCDTCNQCGQFVGPQSCRRSVPNYQRGFLYNLFMSRQVYSPFVGPPPGMAGDCHAYPAYPYYREPADGIGDDGPHPAFGDDGAPPAPGEVLSDGVEADGAFPAEPNPDDAAGTRVSKQPRPRYAPQEAPGRGTPRRAYSTRDGRAY